MDRKRVILLAVVTIALVGAAMAMRHPRTAQPTARLADLPVPSDRIAWILRSGDPSDDQAEQIAAAAAQDTSPYVRQMAVFALRGRAAKYRATLIAAASDSAYWVRATDATALANCPDEEVVELLGRMMNADPFGEVRNNAVDALGKIATPRAADLLQETIPTNSFSTVRIAALKRLETLAASPPAGWDAGRTTQLREAIPRLRPIAASTPAAVDDCDEHEQPLSP